MGLSISRARVSAIRPIYERIGAYTSFQLIRPMTST